MPQTPPKALAPGTASEAKDAATSTPPSTAVPPVPAKQSSLDRFLTWIAGNWWFEVVVFIFAFSVVVLKTNEIQNRFSSLVPAKYAVGIFWFSVVAWVVSFGARKYAESRVPPSTKDQATQLATAVDGIQRSADELKKSIGGIGNTAAALDKKLAQAAQDIDNVLSAVETLPHATFRKAWMDQAFVLAKFGTSPAIRRQDIETSELTEIIRKMLRAAAQLAESYDIGSEARYAANIMFYVENLDAEPHFEHDVWRDVRFKPMTCDQNKHIVDGILILKKELSSLAGQAVADSTLEDIGFIVSKKIENGKWRILPGGPRALAQGLQGKNYFADVYDDITTIDRINANSADFMIEPGILAEVKDYYSAGRGRGVRSFLALTLPRLRNGLADPLGVLNIHSDKPNILGGGDERCQVFAQLMAPFVSEIAWAAEIWASQKNLRLKKP